MNLECKGQMVLVSRGRRKDVAISTVEQVIGIRRNIHLLSEIGETSKNRID
jgi:hypothetical protein